MEKILQCFHFIGTSINVIRKIRGKNTIYQSKKIKMLEKIEKNNF